MSFDGFSRRGFLSGAGAVAAASALPVVGGVPGAVPQAAAAAAAAAAVSKRPDLQKFVDMRFGMFLHFNMGTFTDEEWASPNQDPDRFAPSKVNCAQWAAAAAAAKMSYGVLTTKHHDGFCLWPSEHTDYTVANSGYKKDIVAQYVKAFRAQKLKVGLYYSIWDRSHTVEAFDNRRVGSKEAIQPGDITFILNQLRELLTNYGAIDMLITDGYSWQMGQRAVPYQRIRELVKSLQPNCVMIDIGGLTEPWLGDVIFFEEPLGVAAPDDNTYAGLQGQTISNGWFWHPSTPDERLMSKASILDHLADLEPKWTSLILNCPPNRDGVLDSNIVARLAEVGAAWKKKSRKTLPAQPLRVEYPVTPANAYATAFHTGEGPLNAIDGLNDIRIQTCWSTWSLPLPQSITIDLGGVWSNISTLEYLPKQWSRSYLTNGDITSYTVSTSVDGVTFTDVASGEWAPNGRVKVAEWKKRKAGYVRLQVHAGTDGYANVSELHVGGRTAQPKLLSRLPLTTAAYRLVAVHSDGVAEVAGKATHDGAKVAQGAWTGEDHQKWTVTGIADGYYKIRNVGSGKLLEIADLSRAETANAAIWSDAKAPQQHWAITPVAAGTYLLTNRFSGLALGVADAATTAGASIQQSTYAAKTHQQWKLIPA